MRKRRAITVATKMRKKSRSERLTRRGGVRPELRLRASVLAALLGVCGANAALASGFAGAQPVAAAPPDARPAQLRMVQGRVLDKADKPLVGAVVYLKDTRTLSVKSYLTDEHGHFHFGQLDNGGDYEVWAEQNGSRSGSKSISQFNSKLDIVFTLKIDGDK